MYYFHIRNHLRETFSLRNISLLICLVSILQIKNAVASDYEQYCGDVALACISNCQVFKHKCGGSYVAEVVKNAKPGRISDFQGTNPYVGNSGNSFSPGFGISQYEETCKTQGNVCVVVREYERSECCPGHFCVPFERRNGQRATIGSCKRLDYRDKINPRRKKD